MITCNDASLQRYIDIDIDITMTQQPPHFQEIMARARMNRTCFSCDFIHHYEIELERLLSQRDLGNTGIYRVDAPLFPAAVCAKLALSMLGFGEAVTPHATVEIMSHALSDTINAYIVPTLAERNADGGDAVATLSQAAWEAFQTTAEAYQAHQAATVRPSGFVRR